MRGKNHIHRRGQTDRETDRRTSRQTARQTDGQGETNTPQTTFAGGIVIVCIALFFEFQTVEITEKSPIITQDIRTRAWSTGGHCVYLDVYTHCFHSAFFGRFRYLHQDEEGIGRGMPSAIVLLTCKNLPNQHRNHNRNKTQDRGPKLNYPLVAQLTLVIKSKSTIISCLLV